MAGPVDPRLIRRARSVRVTLAAGVAVGIATAILVLGQGWLLSRVIVDSITQQRLSSWVPIGGLVAIFAVRGLLAWATQVLAHRTSATVKSQLRRDIWAAHAATPGEVHSSSEAVTLVTQGLDALDGWFAKFLPQLGLAVTVPFIVGAVVAVVDWPSAVILAITLPLIPLFMALIGWQTQVRVDRRWAMHNRLSRHFGDLIAGLSTLQVFGRAAAQRRGLTETEDKHRAATMETLRWSFLSSLALELLATLSVALVAVGIGLRVVAGEMDFFAGLFVLIIAPEAYLPVRMVGVHYHDSTDGAAAASAAFAEIERAERYGRGKEPADGAVVVDAVTHTYPGASSPALAEVSVRVDPGEVVALAGPSGGGKTTLCHAVMGTLIPSGGEVRVGETPLAHVDADAWRRRIAYVGQQPGLVRGTVADNIALGDPTADRAALQVALEDVGGTLTLDQAVGDEAEGLSGGERRRVALARALLRIRSGATLLILDEPTAGLDADAEHAAIEAVRRSGASALIVSHRPALLAAADRVVEVNR